MVVVCDYIVCLLESIFYCHDSRLLILCNLSSFCIQEDILIKIGYYDKL